MIYPLRFLISSNLLYVVYYLKAYGRYDFQKCFFLKKNFNGFLKIASFFLLNWSTCSLLPEGFYGFDTSRFHIFFQLFAHFSRYLVLPHYHVIDSTYITMWHNISKYDTINNFKILIDIDFAFNGSDNTFSKNLVEIFFCFNCRFYFVFSRMKFPVQWAGFIGSSWKNSWSNIMILIDS